MSLIISTTNTPGLTLTAVLDKVDTDGVLVLPALRWNNDTEEWDAPGDIPSGDEVITLVETMDGYYEYVVTNIDGSAENVRIVIFYSGNAIGVLYNIPLPLINPDVVIDLTVEEDRD